MLRSMYSGVAGLKVHQTRMDVIGNNIANVNTTAYKYQSINFSDVMYQTSQRASGATATTGGVNIVCKPNYSDLGEDVDNVPNNMKEFKHLDGWECAMAFTSIKFNPK